MHEPSGIQVFTVSGDGNFLFRAHCVGSNFLGGAADLRQRVVQHGTAHPDMEWHGATLQSHQEVLLAESGSTSPVPVTWAEREKCSGSAYCWTRPGERGSHLFVDWKQ